MSKPRDALRPEEGVLQLLRSIDLKLNVLLEAVEGGRGARLQGDAQTAELLRVMRAAVGARVFNSVHLARHAALPAAAGLRAAIVAAVGSLNPRRIGKALRAFEGRDIEGLTVRRVGEDRDGAIWMIAGVRE